MKKGLNFLKKFLWLFCLALFILISGYVLYHGIFHWNGLDDYYQNTNLYLRGFYLILGLILFGLLFIFLAKIINHLSDQSARLLNVIGFVVLVILQISFLCHAPSLLRYDALKVFDEALSMLSDGNISPIVFDGYFSRYTNNYAITLFAYLCLKLVSSFGLLASDASNALFLLQLINILFVDLAFFFGFLLIRAYASYQSSLIYVLFLILSPMSYVWLPFFYTNSISMFFCMASLYLLTEIFIKRNQNPFLLLFCGFLLPIGFFIRATQIIICIAAFIYLVLILNKKPTSLSYILGLLFLGICLGIGGYQLAKNNFTSGDLNDAFPMTHWIAMGLNEQSGGTFDTGDEIYTTSFETAVEKKAADLALIKARVSTLGIKGVAKLYLDKLQLTFSEGTGRYPTELGISNSYGLTYQYVYGNQRFLLQYYCQLMYLLSLLFCIIGAIRLLFPNSSIKSPAFCIYLSMLGAFLFHMIWEAGTIYSIGFICLFYVGFGFSIASFADSQNALLEQSIERKDRIKLLILCFSSFCFCSLFLCFMSYQYKHFQQDRKVWLSVNQYLYLSDSYEPCDDNKKLVQSFETNMPFDEIYIQTENNLGPDNDSIYQIQLLDAQKNIISSTQLVSSEVISYGLTKLALSSPTGNEVMDMQSAINCSKNAPIETYYIAIEKISGKNSLAFLYYDTGNYDAYAAGSLTGLSQTDKPDLCFIVLKVLN